MYQLYLSQINIEPVITLNAPIIQLNKLKPNESVGYNSSFTNLNKETLSVATIPLGYADGFSRILSNKAHVAIDGYLAPIIGKISMDLTIIDVSRIPQELVYLGKQVEIIGPSISIEKIAQLTLTNNYEILTSLGSRYTRIYV